MSEGCCVGSPLHHFSLFSLNLSLISPQPLDSGHFVFVPVTLCLFFWLLFASSPCCPSDVPSFLHGRRVRPLAWPCVQVRIRTATTSYQGSGPALTHVVIGYFMVLVYSGQWLKWTSVRCEMRIQTGGWEVVDVVTANRKQEVG